MEADLGVSAAGDLGRKRHLAIPREASAFHPGLARQTALGKCVATSTGLVTITAKVYCFARPRRTGTPRSRPARYPWPSVGASGIGVLLACSSAHGLGDLEHRPPVPPQPPVGPRHQPAPDPLPVGVRRRCVP